MKDFINWCFDIDSPVPVFIISAILAVVLLMIYIFAIAAFFASGLWVVGLLMLLGAPIWFLIHQYGERDK